MTDFSNLRIYAMISGEILELERVSEIHVYLRTAIIQYQLDGRHKNLIEIMSQEQKFYDKIEKVNNHEPIDDTSITSEEKLELKLNKDVLETLEEVDELQENNL